MSEFVLVLTTLDASGDVAAFARTLVDERLAACVNILPEMESIYRWKSAVETARERQLLIKTVSERLEPLRRRIIHRLRAHELDRTRVLRHDIDGLPHDAHAAFAQLANQSKASPEH